MQNDKKTQPPKTSLSSKQYRRSKRYPFRKRIKFGTKTPEHIGYTVNLSSNGIQVESIKLFPPDTPLVFVILDNLSDNEDNGGITFLGKVVWAKKGITNRGNMGVEFLTQSIEIDNAFKRLQGKTKPADS